MSRFSHGQYDVLEVKPSSIVKHGLGLFTLRTIPKGEIITVYMVEVKYEDSQSEYNLKINSNPVKYIETDGLQGMLLLGAHFCNDVSYNNDKKAIPATVTRKSNNAVAVEGVGIYANRKITIGEEILMDYLWRNVDADDIKKWEFINHVKVPAENDDLFENYD